MQREDTRDNCQWQWPRCIASKHQLPHDITLYQATHPQKAVPAGAGLLCTRTSPSCISTVSAALLYRRNGIIARPFCHFHMNER